VIDAIDAVRDYHMSPMGCGVSKFNASLAQRLDVPLLPLFQGFSFCPLVSVKTSELSAGDLWLLQRDLSRRLRPYDLFLHDVPSPKYRDLVTGARRVYAGNTVIAAAISDLRRDAIHAFCPATVSGTSHRGAYRVLVFGMAHKLLLPHFEQLKQQLEIEHPDYTIELSTAVHEGSPWDTALTESVTAMRGIFGDKLRVLGFLGDDALAKELREVDAVAAYYVPALRANNTSAWAALEAGKKLYTNTDADSPPLDVKLHSWDMLCALIKGAA
jgi:hypothetical protein